MCYFTTPSALPCLEPALATFTAPCTCTQTYMRMHMHLLEYMYGLSSPRHAFEGRAALGASLGHHTYIGIRLNNCHHCCASEARKVGVQLDQTRYSGTKSYSYQLPSVALDCCIKVTQFDFLAFGELVRGFELVVRGPELCPVRGEARSYGMHRFLFVDAVLALMHPENHFVRRGSALGPCARQQQRKLSR